MQSEHCIVDLEKSVVNPLWHAIFEIALYKIVYALNIQDLVSEKVDQEQVDQEKFLS